MSSVKKKKGFCAFLQFEKTNLTSCLSNLSVSVRKTQTITAFYDLYDLTIMLPCLELVYINY